MLFHFNIGISLFVLYHGFALMKTPQAQSPSASRKRKRKAPPPPVFPDDLIVEILSWLPVKSLMQFRCVCKSWKSLISDPNFVRLQLHRSAKNPNLLLVWDDDESDNGFSGVLPCSVRSLMGSQLSTINEDDCFPLIDNSVYRFVVGSCNGLVCFYQHTKRKYVFYLWNPATKLTSKYLTTLPFKYDHSYRFAFGYDNLSDTYKVLAFRVDPKAKEESQKLKVKICSLGDNCWRNIHSFPVLPFDNPWVPRLHDGVYFNGTLNWLALRNNYRWDDTITIAQFVIVSLDLGMETYTQLSLPRLDEAPPVEPTIGVLMDCLCFSHDRKETHFVVWQMKEFGVEKSWTQFMKISYQSLQIDFYDFSYPWLPLCMSENGDILIMATIYESQAILYHRRDNRVEGTELPDYICWKSTMVYVESLVSPCCS